jgi:hypothetical protein
MNKIHIGALLVGALVGYALGARFPSTLPFIGKKSGS